MLYHAGALRQLNELGADASVYQPGGPPPWFKTKARMAPPKFVPTADDTLVFPEALAGWLAEMAQAQLPAKKFLFCQNQYIAANTGIPAATISSSSLWSEKPGTMKIDAQSVPLMIGTSASCSNRKSSLRFV